MPESRNATDLAIRLATPEDLPLVESGLCAKVPQRDAKGIRDKFGRFAGRDGRATLLLFEADMLVGMKCVKVSGDPPPGIARALRDRLAQCGTGNLLYVLRERRGSGIAEPLYRAGEDWCAAQGRTGFWLVTRRLRPWYERRLGYHLAAWVDEDGTRKTLMVRYFPASPPA